MCVKCATESLVQGKCQISVNWYYYNPCNVVILLSKWGKGVTMFVRHQTASRCWEMNLKRENLRRGWSVLYLVCKWEEDLVKGLLRLCKLVCHSKKVTVVEDPANNKQSYGVKVGIANFFVYNSHFLFSSFRILLFQHYKLWGNWMLQCHLYIYETQDLLGSHTLTESFHFTQEQFFFRCF